LPEAKKVVLLIDKPHFQVKLHSDILEVDLKEGVRKELEDLAEARPFLRDSLGWIFQTIIPLDVHLYQIEEVKTDKNGQLQIKIPGRRDIHIPLEPSEARQLVDKLNELMPIEKENALRREQMAMEAERERERSEAYKALRKPA
jgi:hypothetical protein